MGRRAFAHLGTHTSVRHWQMGWHCAPVAAQGLGAFWDVLWHKGQEGIAGIVWAGCLSGNSSNVWRVPWGLNNCCEPPCYLFQLLKMLCCSMVAAVCVETNQAAAVVQVGHAFITLTRDGPHNGATKTCALAT